MAALLTLVLVIAHVLSGAWALRFASYYGDHMVLQGAPQSAVVWGFANKIDDTVSVTISRAGAADVTASAKVTKNPHGTDGIWKVKVGPITEHGPYSVTAKSSEGTVTLKDVLFGDVWLCSGQSNMGFAMTNVINSTHEIQMALNFTNIRYVRAGLFQSNIPLTDLHALSPWTMPTAATLKPFSAVCWLFGEYLYPHVKRPIGLVETQWGGTPIEAWSSHDANAACSHSTAKRGPGAASVLWNAMIVPFLPQTIYGAIWYQGEANSGRPEKYACQFPAMINDWRQKFYNESLGTTDVNFPFGFVQLAPNNPNMTRVAGFPPTRWAQTANVGYVPNQKLPNTFMAVAMDLPDFHAPTGTIHPRYKQDVGHRLVLGARAVAYGEKDVEFQGPFPKTIVLGTNNVLVITYDHGPIEVRNENGFEVCCSATAGACGVTDHWAPARTLSHTDTSVVLDTAGCGTRHVTSVRYEWRESPCLLHVCAIYSQKTGLPAPTFILAVK